MCPSAFSKHVFIGRRQKKLELGGAISIHITFISSNAHNFILIWLFETTVDDFSYNTYLFETCAVTIIDIIKNKHIYILKYYIIYNK